MNKLCEHCQYNCPYLSIINPCENCPNNDFPSNQCGHVEYQFG